MSASNPSAPRGGGSVPESRDPGIPDRIEFLPGGNAQLLNRLLTRWRRPGQQPQPWAIVEGDQLRLWARPSWAALARRTWVSIPLPDVTGVFGGSGGRGHDPLGVSCRQGRHRVDWIVGRELEGGSHSFRAAMAAILDQQKFERAHPEKPRSIDGVDYRRRIEMRAKFAVGTGHPGFLDYDG